LDGSLSPSLTVRSGSTIDGKDQDMRKTLCIVIGLAIAAASAAQGQQPSPIQHIIAQENAHSMTLLRRHALRASTSPEPTPPRKKTIYRAGNPNPNPGGLGDHPPNPIQVRPDNFPRQQTVPTSVVVTVDRGGFDWGDAGIGAAAGVALVLLGAGGVVLVRDGRRQKAHG
jgi:hypothetical protein